MNFGLANTIVQECAPAHLRGRVSAIVGLSFFGLMPVAGLLITSLADWIGMRSALASGALAYGAGSLIILGRVERKVAQGPALAAPEPEIAALP
jgi:MFS family permease